MYTNLSEYLAGFYPYLTCLKICAYNVTLYVDAGFELRDMQTETTTTPKKRMPFFLKWFDGHTSLSEPQDLDSDRIDRIRVVPFILMHLACGLVYWVGYSHIALAVAIGLYLLRMFVITGFYHRYFSHRAFQTSRAVQFIAACIGCMCAQRGPLWWAGHHRHHHKHSDEFDDLHSPGIHGFIWSHMLWFLAKSGMATPMQNVQDWKKYPEIVFIDRFDWIPLLVFGFGLYGLGAVLGHYFPGLQTSGWQIFVWGFFISTVVVYHATYTINSLAHKFGSRRYDTGDDSRNNFWLAILTLGEGWHNNQSSLSFITSAGILLV